MKDENTFPRVDGSIRNNLAKFADNLTFTYFTAHHHRFDEKWVKSATQWNFVLSKYTVNDEDLSRTTKATACQTW